MKRLLFDSHFLKGTGKSMSPQTPGKMDDRVENPIGFVTSNGIFAENKDFLVVRIDKLSNIRKI